MPLHSIGSGNISFGLVSIPIRMFTAASSESVSFNQIHPKCGQRIKQQLLCPTCNEVVDRSSLVKGYEFAKDQYVQFTEDELKTLEDEASKMIDIDEFVPLDQVDPIYFEKTYYLGPDKGGEKAYRLLADAMTASGRVALAKFVMRGKENLVLIRAAKNGLMLHTMYFANEIRDFGEVDKGEDAKVKSGELDLAQRLVVELTSEKFQPEKYADEYRGRVLALVEQKVEGKEITSAAPQPQRTQVIDLMDALKQSLGKRGSSSGRRRGIAGRQGRQAREETRRARTPEGRAGATREEGFGRQALSFGRPR
jgi:DNA end-binding protein Ku